MILPNQKGINKSQNHKIPKRMLNKITKYLILCRKILNIKDKHDRL